VTSSELQGWYDDPFRLHQARYFSAGRPTKLVRDGAVESYDEPPAEIAPGPGAAAAPAPAVTGTLYRGAVGVESVQASGSDPWVADQRAYRQRGPRAGVLVSIAALLTAGGVTAALLAGKSGPTAAPVTALMAYTATMNAGSADVSSSFAITSANHKLDVIASESGPMSWSANQGEAVLDFSLDGKQFLTGRQIFDGSTVYSKLGMNGVTAGVLGIGTGWTETTWTGESSPAASGTLAGLLLWGLTSPSGMTSPASLLAVLNAQATSVLNLGDEVLAGVSTTHYRAIIPLSRLGTGSAADERQAEQVLGASSIGVDYWVDSARLLRQLRLDLTVQNQPPDPTPSSAGEVTIPLTGLYPMTLAITLQLSRYGVPVDVVPPSAAQITSRVTCTTTQDGFSCPAA
jgi:hypothetical protein